MPKTAIIIGAGPAGLTAAYELLKRTDIKPIILEKSGDIGGISKTIDYKGNRMDMGPHRFFSKSDRVMNWWLNLFPFDAAEDRETVTVHYQNRSRTVDATGGGPADGKDPDKVMVVIQRLTRIYFLRKFFAYPIRLSLDTLKSLGLIRTVRIIASYLYARLFPRRPVNSLEDFIVNQFGRQLYGLFFKDYTEKVWGVPCSQISAEWGAQRIKGVSLSKAISHAIQALRKKKNGKEDIGQKALETSLVEQFLYPKRGPGQLWEEVARQIQELGGQVYLHQDVRMVKKEGDLITSVHTVNSSTGQAGVWEGEYFFSTMPVQELIEDLNGSVPSEVQEIAAGLQYRDFINVGILLRQLSVRGKNGGTERLDLKDNWIYIQERDVKVGRLMIYNNWGNGMIKDPNTVWIGMEYFCNKSDSFWALSDEAIRQIAIGELVKMDLARAEDVLDSTVARMEKTYPAYFGTYDRFGEIRDYLDAFANLFLIGRNGMHKYNNADHSMLTAMVAVDNILAGVTSKANLWSINTEQEYHEKKHAADPPTDKKTIGAREQVPALSFPQFIFRQHKPLTLSLMAALVIEFVVFKTLYPFANFMFDSLLYIEGASTNSDVNIWPIGYSKFLRLFSAISHWDTALVFFQFALLQACLIYVFFTILYFIKPGKIYTYSMILFMLINPAYLSISNYVLSDALFTALSLFWFGQLIWLIFKPTKKILYSHAVLLFVLFTIRYNAMYYPIISVIVILAAQLNWRHKAVSILVSACLFTFFVNYESTQYRDLTGKTQFSAFVGWQLASNALFMYRNLPHPKEPGLPANLTALNRFTVHELDSFNTCKPRPDSVPQLYYLWMESSPLKRYLAEKYNTTSNLPYFTKWASVAPMYGQYGKLLISNHYAAFAQYFIWPNIKWFFAPPIEFLGEYNLGRDSIDNLERNWFRYHSPMVRSVSKEILWIDKSYPAIGSILTLSFLIVVACILSFVRGCDLTINLKRFMALCLLLWLVNFLFSILAAPIVLRYQLFSLAVSFSFASLFIDYIVQLEKNKERASYKQFFPVLANP